MYNIKIKLQPFDIESLKYEPAIDITSQISQFKVNKQIGSAGEKLTLNSTNQELYDLITPISIIQIQVNNEFIFNGFVESTSFTLQRGSKQIAIKGNAFAGLLEKDELAVNPFAFKHKTAGKIEKTLFSDNTPSAIIQKIFQNYFINKFRTDAGVDFAWQIGQNSKFWNTDLFNLITTAAEKGLAKHIVKATPRSGTVWSQMKQYSDEPVNLLYCETESLFGKQDIILSQNPIPYSTTIQSSIPHSVKQYNSRGLWNKLPQTKITYADVITANLSKSFDKKTYFITKPAIYGINAEDIGYFDVIYPAVKQTLNDKIISFFGVRAYVNQAMYVRPTQDENTKKTIKEYIIARNKQFASWYGGLISFEQGTLQTKYMRIGLGTKLYLSDSKKSFFVRGVAYDYTYGQKLTTTITVDFGEYW